MLFSDVFGISHIKVDDWFDPILLTDALLFLDAFRAYGSGAPRYADCHPEIAGGIGRSVRGIWK